MNDERQESVLDVLAEMFELGDKWCGDESRTKIECMGLIVHQLARRIKEALDRESKLPGNVAALRIALMELRNGSRDLYHQILNSKYSGILDKYTCVKQGFPAVLAVRSAIVMANLALVAPARNCDVGTVGEQFVRFLRGDESTIDCAGPDARWALCALKWSQKPYEKGAWSV